MGIGIYVHQVHDIATEHRQVRVADPVALPARQGNLKWHERFGRKKLLKFFPQSIPPHYRSNSAAMMLMLPSTATTSLIMWPSIILGKTW
jgi:hypothetical protein